MSIKELRAQLAAAKAKGKTKLEAYNALVGKADRTEDEEKQLATLSAELDAIETEVETLDASLAAEEKKIRRQGLFASTALRPAARATAVNDLNPATTGGFRSMAEFANSVRAAAMVGHVDERLAAAPSTTMQNGGAVGEGYLVPPEFRQAIWSLVFEGSDLLGRFVPEPTNSNAVSITKDETTPWGSTGVQAYWGSELGAMTASRHAHVSQLVELHKLYAFVAASDELLSDAPRLASRLTVAAAAAIRWKAGESLMTGNGVGKPFGFMNSAALVSVAKESGQAAATIVAANVGKMFSRLLAQGMGGAFWLANPDTLPQLMVLAIGNQPIWTPPNAGFADAPGGYLLGRPIIFSEHGETLGTKGDIVLVSPPGYYLATKDGGGIDFASSIHLWFDQAATAFRWTFRLGGQPMLSAPVNPAKGSNTKSHFVSLDTRA